MCVCVGKWKSAVDEWNGHVLLILLVEGGWNEYFGAFAAVSGDLCHDEGLLIGRLWNFYDANENETSHI